MTRRVVLLVGGLDNRAAAPLAVESALAGRRGVLWVYVSTMTETAYVEYDSSSVGVEELVHEVESAGLSVTEVIRRPQASAGTSFSSRLVAD